MTVEQFPLSEEEIGRYSRQLIIPEIGARGQEKLRAARVLCAGAGGLCSASSYYLCAAGVGTLGLLDSDRVDISNLHRQILHFTPDLGRPKVVSAREKLEALNPNVRVVTYDTRISAENVAEILADWDVVLDGFDNFASRFLLRDACYFLRKPLVEGSVFRLEGQATVFLPGEGNPCHRCLYPEPPPAGLAPSCREAGVLGVVPGVIGLIQATEAIKLIVGVGRPLVATLLCYDALETSFRSFSYRKRADCPLCGQSPTITGLATTAEACGDS